jgi:hypothetical protein
MHRQKEMIPFAITRAIRPSHMGVYRASTLRFSHTRVTPEGLDVRRSLGNSIRVLATHERQKARIGK